MKFDTPFGSFSFQGIAVEDEAALWALNRVAGVIREAFVVSDGPVADGMALLPDMHEILGFVHFITSILHSRNYKESSKFLRIEIDKEELLKQLLEVVKMPGDAKQEVAADTIVEKKPAEDFSIDYSALELREKVAKVNDYKQMFTLLKWDLENVEKHFDEMTESEGLLWHIFIDGIYGRSIKVPTLRTCEDLTAIEDHAKFREALKYAYKHLNLDEWGK